MDATPPGANKPPELRQTEGPAEVTSEPEGEFDQHNVKPRTLEAGLLEQLNPDQRPESSVQLKPSHFVKEPSAALFHELATDGTVTAITIKKLACDHRFFMPPELVKPIDSLYQKIRSGEVDVLDWDMSRASCAFALLCLGIYQLKIDSAPEDKKQAFSFIDKACATHPEFCQTQLNCWLCYELLAKESNLSADAQTKIRELLNKGSKTGLATAKWMLSLADMGLLKNMPANNPVNGIYRMFLAGRAFNMPAIDSKAPFLGFASDPIAFSWQEGLARSSKFLPVSELKHSASLDERFFYQCLPGMIVACSTMPSARKLFNRIESCFSEGEYSSASMLFGCHSVFYNNLTLLNLDREGRQAQLKDHWNKAGKTGLQALTSEGGGDKVLEQVERIHIFLNRAEHLNEDPTELIGGEKRRAAILIKSVMEDLIKGPVHNSVKALLLVYIGVIYENRYIRINTPVDSAMEFYARACCLLYAEGLARRVENHYVKNGQYQKAVEFLNSTSKFHTDQPLLQDKIKFYELQKKRIEREGVMMFSLTDSDIERIINELGIVSEQDGSKTKKKKRRKKKTVPLGENALLEAALKPEPLKSVSLKADPVKTPEPIATLDETTPKDVEESKADDSGWQTALPARRKLNKLLPSHWLPQVSEYLKLALYYRYETKDYQSERRTLEQGIEKLKDGPGVERLREELAWHLIYLERDPVRLLDHAETQAESQLKDRALACLDEAEDHIKYGLARKLRCPVSLVPLASDERQKRVDQIADRFEFQEEKDEYVNGVHFLMSSLGHVQSERAALVSRGGQNAVQEKMRDAYSGKYL